MLNPERALRLLSDRDKNHEDHPVSEKFDECSRHEVNTRKNCSFQVHLTSLLPPCQVLIVSTHFLPSTWSCACHVPCILTMYMLWAFKSHLVFTTHLPLSHCVLPALCYHPTCRFSCVSIYKTMPLNNSKTGHGRKGKSQGRGRGSRSLSTATVTVGASAVDDKLFIFLETWCPICEYQWTDKLMRTGPLCSTCY